jgi:hypothetical protein
LLVRGSIQGQLCSKPRAEYAAQSFLALSEEAGMHKSFSADQLDIACDDDNQYVCGSQLFPAGHKLDEAVCCNHSLTCSSLVESNLYKANSATLNKLADSFAVSLCSSCGTKHLAPKRSEQLGCNQILQRLLSKLASVKHMQRQRACGPSEEVQGHTSCCKAEGGWCQAQTQGQQRVG